MFASVQPLFRPSILSAKKRLLEGRETIKQQHQAGSPGIQVCARLTELLDAVVLELYEAAIAELYPGGAAEIASRLVLVADHGGYGRRDVAPFSDVDLMILHEPNAVGEIEPLARRLMRDLFDVGLNVGQTVRTPAEACRLAAKDATICTSLIEARFLAGGDKLFESFVQGFVRATRGRLKQLLVAIEKARLEERSQYDETVYLLEPNVKRSPGTLRDLQLLRWIGFARYGTPESDNLQLLGALTKEEQASLRRAREFLLRLRNEMHFHAGKPYDVLDRSEQLRMARLYDFTGTEAILPVEQFMREYFGHTHHVRTIVEGFVANARPGPRWSHFWGTLFSHQVEGDYRITPRQIVATRRGLAKLKSELNEVVRLADLANLYDKRISQSTWKVVKAAVPTFEGEVNAETGRRFLSLMSQPARLGELLRRLHELSVLEKIIPAFSHARCLLQFNEYHKYTVDEHCLRAVERATQFLSDTGPLGRVYQGIKQKRTLHLALLIHDLGKGFVEDHSEVGQRIAEDTAVRLSLPQREAETLKFLVHKHLLMSHLAFRRDTSDDQLVVRFAVEVGSPEVLDMLFVLTAADFDAVGPGVWNAWKAKVLIDLYQQAMKHLAGDAPTMESADELYNTRQAIRACLASEEDAGWFKRQIDALPSAYLRSLSPDKIAEELRDLHTLGPADVHASGRYMPERRIVEFIVGTQENVTPGVFHKLTGALASQGLQILAAEINTLADGLVLDRFYVHDPDFAGAPPAVRIEDVKRALVDSLLTPRGDAPSFRKIWRSDLSRDTAALAKLPTRVRIDNSTSDRYTILDIFASDRMGLLYTIARTLFQMGLSVSIAKIGTYLDQVVDVFYVTDQSGAKITDEQWLQQISAKLLEAIDAKGQD